jgi:hypothetical protein
MSVHFFSNGGAVFHKMPAPGYRGTFSAWVDDNGKLLDCCYSTSGRAVASSAVNLREAIARAAKARFRSYTKGAA